MHDRGQVGIERPHPNVGASDAKRLDKRRQQVRGDERRRADRDHLIPCAGAAAGDRRRVVDVGQGTADDRQERGAVPRQRHLPRRALEHAESELRFDLAHQHADAGRRHEERLGGTRETAAIGDRDEPPQLSGREFH